MKPRCENCACWTALGKQDQIPAPEGTCYRRAPQVIVLPQDNVAWFYTDTVWPTTKGYNGCWDFISKEKRKDTP